MQRSKELAEVGVDMTPMIDVVFNLIIFFMLVNQMVQQERAELELPVASQAQEERMADKNRLIINVHKNGRIEVSGRTVEWAELARILLRESRMAKSGTYSQRSVLIRGDIETPYRHIQKVLVECAQKKIYRISFAAKIPR